MIRLTVVYCWFILFILYWSIGLITSVYLLLSSEMFIPIGFNELSSRILFNQICIELPLLWWILDFSVPFSLSRLVPSLIYSTCIAEALFYVIHRLLHTRFLYRHVHSIHHRWIHPIPLVASYCHPLEHLFLNLFPITLGPILFRMDPITLMVWLIMCVVNTLVAHLPANLSHHKHHTQRNVKYGIVGVLDYFLKT
jgi:sterol desaturase/sphingolipid hydroxylase (fatty acid hydroxylase superfamily)